MNKFSKNYRLADFDQIPSTPCPCGSAKRGFVDDEDGVASMHLVTIENEARRHYHRKMTEIYYILEGSGTIELDRDLIEVGPGQAILIKPLCRHRLIGHFKILNIPIPAFDPEDEWFDDV